MKRAAYPPQHLKDERREWAASHAVCFICRGDGGWIGLQTHEIASKAICGSRNWACVANYIRLCGSPCHEIFDSLPEAAQLGFKMLSDPDSLDVPLINRLRGRAPNAIDVVEVRLWARFIQAIRGEHLVRGR